MIRRFIRISSGVAATWLLVSASAVYAVSLTNSYTDGGVWNTVFVQGFSPSISPTPDLGLSFTDNVSLEKFQFFKSGNADTIGTASGPASVQLVIVNNIFADLTNLSTSSSFVVGLSSNSISSTANIATGAPITFTFNALQLQDGNNYAAIVVSNNNGALTPVQISALTANYTNTGVDNGDGLFHPTTNYGSESQYVYSTSNFINSNSFGMFFNSFSYAGDANFVATMNHVVLGDFNNDSSFTTADVQAAMAALSDLNTYESTNNLSAPDLITMGDFNQDGVFDSLDIQAMISALANGGGSSSLTAVPEPTSAVLLALGGTVLCYCSRRQRNAS
ncbi:MAG TPA: PEP-CTERM sorting domain-containing protein [Pirellulales bacterium]